MKALLDLLPEARARAYAPISGYQVGAVALGASGRMYIGANIEFPELPLGCTVHAEQAAVANAYMAGEQSVTAIAVSAEPCGHCRQFLREISPDGSLQVFLPDASSLTLAELHPRPFGPANLGFKQGIFPPRETAMSPPVSDDVLVLAAIDAARRSYAPYTKAHSGFVAATESGRTFAGAYLENAAFNPSLSPLHVAMAVLFASGAQPSALVRAVLVEIDGAPISQQSIVRAGLAALAPQARFDVVLATLC